MKKILARLCILLSLLAGLLILIGTTQSGLRATGYLAKRLTGGHLSYTQLSGTLLHSVRIAHLTYQTPHTHWQSNRLSITWQPLDLLRGTLHIQDIQADTLTITPPPLSHLTSHSTASKRKTNWLNLQVDAVTLHALSLTPNQAHTLHVDQARYQLRRDANGNHTLSGLIQAGPAHLILEGEGTPAHYTFDLTYRSHHQTTRIVRGTGHFSTLRFSPPASHAPEAPFSLEGTLHLRAPYQFNLTADLNKANFSWIDPMAPQALTAHIQAQGDRRQHTLKAQLSTPHNQLALTSQDEAIDWRINAPALNEYYGTLQGDLQSEGSAHQQNGHWISQGTARARTLGLQAVQIQGLAAHWDLQQKATWGLTLNNLSLPQQIRLQDISAGTLSKDPSRITLRMARGQSTLTSQWSLPASPIKRGDTFLLQSLSISTPQQPTWQLAAPHTLTLYPNLSTQGLLCLKSTDQEKVCGSLSISPAHQWSGQLVSKGFNIMPFFSLLSPEISGTVSLATDCEAQGAGTKLTEGHCRLHTTDTAQHSLRYKKERIPIEQIDIQLKQSKQGATGKGLIALSPRDRIHLTLNPTGTGTPQLRVQGQLTRLPFVNTLCDPYVSIEGTLNTDLQLTAQPAGIDAEGTLSLTEGSVQVKPTQTDYHDITVQIKTDDTHTLGYVLSGYSNQSAFQINGTMDPLAATLNGKLTGENLVISHTPEYEIIGTPEATFSLEPPLFTLQGNVQVNTANIAVKKLSFIEHLPINDITYVDTNTSTHRTHWKKDMQLNVTLGDHIHLNAYGIQARLAGRINLTGKEDAPFLGNGRIHVVQGTYGIYGKTLTITPGSFIQFIQTPLNNPLLNITASKTIDTNASQLSEKTNEDNLIVGVNITGSAQKPKVAYFSNLASLSQSDILTRLLLSSNSAKDNLLKKQNTYQDKDSVFQALISSLKNTIQSTDFGVQSNNVTDPIHSPIHQQTRYLIGKRITPRLYARYIIGHGNQAIDAEGAQTLFELHYLLSRQFSLLLSSGNLNTLDGQFDTGLDIRYQSKKD